MNAIIGLGNPGLEYEATRHNTGFLVIDELCKRFKTRLSGGKGDYLIGRCSHQNRHMVFAKPLTYMNNSGLAARDIITHFGLSLRDVFVICDDFQLPLGKLRLRPRGTDGGHNGLYSIIYHLHSEEFPRLRCGIGSEKMPRGKLEKTEFVLSPFERDELPVVGEMVKRAADAVVMFVAEGIDVAMNMFNK